MTDDDDIEFTVGVREESSSKNPIRLRLRTDRPQVDADGLVGIVACGRDFFHSFISQTIRRRYRRPPIYLVDSWVTKALGVFMGRGGVLVPDPDSLRPGADPLPSIDGFAPVVRLFEAVQGINDHLRGAQLLRVAAIAGGLEVSALRLLTERSEIEALRNQCQAVEEFVVHAVSVLSGDRIVRPHLNVSFAEELQVLLRRLMEAAQHVVDVAPPSIPGISFGPDRGSGVLFGSIKELDIEGPAILLAPQRIRQWAESDLKSPLRLIKIPLSGRVEWFGARSDEDLLFSLGISNVLQHELTHAMLALPNDPVQDLGEMTAERWAFYKSHTDFEEGLANFTAAVCSAVLIMKAKFEIRGTSLPVLHRGRYAAALRELQGLMKATYQTYYPESTNVFFGAWQQNKVDYGAFAGLVKMFATNFGGLNWLESFEALKIGRIATGQ